MKLKEQKIAQVVIGSGAAGFQSALRLYQNGEWDLTVVTENINAGTSRNTGSDKQTYYKLTLSGKDPDSVENMAEDLFAGQCVDGDQALCEAALSARCFFALTELGVPFPCTEQGEFMGYKTDHDRGRRATSAGPYTSRLMTEALEKAVKEKEIRILDKMQVIKLLTFEGRIKGVLCLDKKEKEEPSYVLIWCENVILATGGPAGMYHDSVYPVSQTGSTGMAFEAGAVGKNLTEWQFGMASLNPRWNVSSKYTYSWANKLPEVQKLYGRGEYNTSGAFIDKTMDSWGDRIDGMAYDNIDDFFQGSSVWDNSVSVSGGSKNGSFYLSGSNYHQSGIIPTTGYDKTTFRFNGEQKYGILTVGANVSYSQASTDKTLTSAGLYGQGGNGAMTAVYGWPVDDQMSRYLNDDGSKYRILEGLQDLEDDVENPYWILNKNTLTDETSRFTGAVNASLKLTDWWDVSARAGIDKYTTSSNTLRRPGGAVKQIYQNGYMSKGDVNYQYITTNVMSNFHKTFGDFDLNLLVGTTTEATKTTNNTRWGYNFVTEGLYSFNNIIKANQYFKESTVRKRMVGLYGEFRASYKNLVYLTVTGRNDWSSTLPVNNRSYFYPSVSGSFVFTELLPKNNVLSFGKIRGSWARVGKDADAYSLGYYMWPVATLNGGKYGMGNSWTGGSVGLKPEIQDSYELGLEMRFFNGRLGFDYTYYQSKTKDQICAPRLAQSTGYIFLTLNGGSVENKGMELSITGKPIVTKDFQWETTLNLSGNRGRLGDFIDGVDIFYVTDAQVGAAKAGSIPNGGYFLGLTGNKYETAQGPDGKMYNVIDPSTGLYKDTQVETNIVGNREPKLIGGFNNSFSYKNFNLSFLFDIRLGGDIYNGTEYYLVTKGLSTKTINRESVSFTGVVNTGTAAKPSYETKTITYNANETYQVGNSTRSGKYMIQEYYKNYAKNAYNFITDTNWLRLRSISLSYDFKDLLKKQNIIKGLTATITGTNLFVWTNYKGMDPETCVSGSGTGGSGSAGIDYCGVPATAGMSFGINLTF